jgi:molecular chaperone GrpE (heat shock protein)
VVRFTAERLAWVDPLIHTVAAEKQDPNAPAGVVLETVKAGYRTGRGAVLARAAVVINRG